MRHGERLELAIIWIVRATIAFLMLPLILAYALLVGLVYPIAMVVTTARPGTPRPVLGRVSA